MNDGHRLSIVVDGRRLWALRVDQQLTQKALADLAGVSVRTVSRIEEMQDIGKQTNRRTWLQLCAALKLRTAEAKQSILVFEEYADPARKYPITYSDRVRAEEEQERDKPQIYS